ncbi:MAG: hypothetical protein KDE27_32570 [Planctomycetes bacterium]|nr:hypothetical protein [Planctomycetota bacterium]
MRSAIGPLLPSLAAVVVILHGVVAIGQSPTREAAIGFLRATMPASDREVVSDAALARDVELALTARARVPWGSALADELFLHFVVPYAQANETREDWRSDFASRFLPRVLECATPGEAAQLLNRIVFDELKVHYSTGRRRADQAPSESIAQGKATCTGLSILLADACRACCVPARLVSVQWPHKRGNHTWVEVWDGAGWRFCGADEPDPNGLDRAWFVGDAAQCAAADRDHRIWAVSFAPTGERFHAGWSRDVELHGIDVTARYAAPTQDPAADADAALAAQLDRWFLADAATRAGFEFDRNLDAELATAAGDARLRALVAAAWRRHERPLLQPDHDARIVRANGKQSPFTVKLVGERPAGGLPLVIAMHGGGGVQKRVNDSQWRHMQVYYRDHPEVSGYLYCALRAPTDEWNGFYTDYFYPVLEQLIRQFVVCDGVDPDRVIAIGYSHGGYGAFAIGPKLPHRFAAVHSSAAAPTDGESVADGLHSLRFSFMVGGEDRDYGRRERCEAFAESLRALQAGAPGRYPTTFTLVEGNGHTGLPDRDLLAELVPLARDPLPRRLIWQPTDVAVRDHYWLRVAAARRGQRLVADAVGQQLEYALVGCEAGDGVEAWLDARLFDLSRPVEVHDVGAVPARAAVTCTPAPLLRVLCATMLERGDPRLAATWILALH